MWIEQIIKFIFFNLMHLSLLAGGLAVLVILMSGMRKNMTDKNSVMDEIYILNILLLLVLGGVYFYDSWRLTPHFFFKNSGVNYKDFKALYQLVTVLVIFIYIVIIITPSEFWNSEEEAEDCLLITTVMLGFLLTLSTNNMLSAYFVIEFQNVSFFLKDSLKKESSCSNSRLYSKFMTHSISSMLFLTGAALLYRQLETLNFDSYKIVTSSLMLMKNAHILKDDLTIVYLAVFFIIVSFFMKITLTPTYRRSSEVYSDLPHLAVLFFVVVPKLNLFIMFYRILNFSFSSLLGYWPVLAATMLLTLIGLWSAIKVMKHTEVSCVFFYSFCIGIVYNIFTNVEGGTETFDYYFLFSLAIIFFVTLSKIVERRFENVNYPEKLGVLRSSTPMLSSLTVTLFYVADFYPFVGFLMQSLFLVWTFYIVYLK